MSYPPFWSGYLRTKFLASYDDFIESLFEVEMETNAAKRKRKETLAELVSSWKWLVLTLSGNYLRFIEIWANLRILGILFCSSTGMYEIFVACMTCFGHF